MDRRTTVESIWFDDIKNGNYDIALGVIISTLLDPSDYFRAWYIKDGPRNQAFWGNPKFATLMLQIARGDDPAKRLALIRQAEMIMEEDPPLPPICWEKINDAWYTDVNACTPTTISASTTSIATTRSGWTNRPSDRSGFPLVCGNPAW